MADNVAITAGAGTTIATDDVSSVQYQVVKIGLGADGAIDTLVDSGQQTMANSVPVALASNQSALPITDNSGSLTVDAPTGTPVNVQIGNATLVAGVIDETGASAVDALAVGGGTAHDAVDSGNPIKIGFHVETALPTAVAANDRANGICDVFGRQLTSHIDAGMQIWKSYNDTSSRAAGSAQILWTPTGGKKIVITHVTIATYGTTAARMFLFLAANADLTYSAGTDQPIFVGSFAPSTTSKPGVVICPATPMFAATADHKLLYQNDAALSVDIVVFGYEV